MPVVGSAFLLAFDEHEIQGRVPAFRHIETIVAHESYAAPAAAVDDQPTDPIAAPLAEMLSGTNGLNQRQQGLRMHRAPQNHS